MSLPAKLSLLDGLTVGRQFSKKNGASCYPATHNESGQRYIIKKISIPESKVQVEALLLSNAFSTEDAADAYFKSAASRLTHQVELLDKLSQYRYFTSFAGSELVHHDKWPGYDLYLMSEVGYTLTQWMNRHIMTQLDAINLSIDICAALAVSREVGYLYANLNPNNIFVSDSSRFSLGDLGFLPLATLNYAALPAEYVNDWTAPEVRGIMSTPNTTMDTYALGMLLYQIFNGGVLPFQPGQPAPKEIAPPAYADFRLGRILLKAIDPDPAQRFVDPMQMGRTLLTYTQRVKVSHAPIVPLDRSKPLPTEPAEDDRFAPMETAEEEKPEAVEAQPEPPVEEKKPASARRKKRHSAQQAPEPVPAAEVPAEPEPVQPKPVEEAAVPPEPVQSEPVEEAPAETESVPAEASPAESEPAPAEEAPTEPEPVQPEPVENTPAPSEPPAPAKKSKKAKKQPAPPPKSAPRSTLVLEFAPDATPLPPVLPILPEIDEQTLKKNLDEALEQLPEENFEIPESVFEQGLESFEYPLDEEDFRDVPAEQEESPVVVYIPEDVPMQSSRESAELLCKVDELIDKLSKDAPVPETLSEPEPEPDYEPEPVRHRSKGQLGWIFALLLLVVLAAGTAGGFYYYQNFYLQSIDDLVVKGSEDRLVATLFTTTDSSLLTVSCKGDDGSSMTADVIGGNASFEGLAPSTHYELAVSIAGRHQLIGKLSGSYDSPGRAVISDMASVTGATDGTTIVTFQAEGSTPVKWKLTYFAEDEPAQEMLLSSTTAVINDLTPDKEYTCFISGDDSVYVTGETELRFTASKVITARQLAFTEFTDGKLTALWGLQEEGLSVLWHTTLTDSNGNVTTQDTREPTISFTGLDPALRYTLKVQADNMTKDVTVSVGPDTPVLSALDFEVTNPTNLLVSWEFAGEKPDKTQLVFSLDGSDPYALATEENSVRVAPAAPGSHYDFYMVDAEGNLILNSLASFDMPKAEPFSGFNVTADDISAKLILRPEDKNWTAADVLDLKEQTTFSVKEKASMLLYVQPKYGISSNPVGIVTIIRTEEGQTVVMSGETRTWSSIWSNHYGTLNISQLPKEAGRYVVSIYFNGQHVLDKSFTMK